ncbi:MAG: branched-chain amino acid transport system permease protein [Candidatus Poriferisodalaceae bacterium]|jgi:branched-chain amino acid transport system permease protein
MQTETESHPLPPTQTRYGTQRYYGYLFVSVVLLFLLARFWNDPIALRNVTKVVITVLAVLGVNVATGYGGMISLGHGVFVGVGAFATGWFVDDVGLPWALAIPAGAIVAALSGCLVGVPALRIRGIHLALVTLAIAVLFQPLAKQLPRFTGGVSGKPVESTMDAPSWLGDSRAADSRWQFFVCVAVILLAFWLTRNLLTSGPGRAIRSLRDNQTAAAIFGVDLVRTRVGTFAVSAGLAGLTGALQVVLVPFVSQENYPPQNSLILYAAAVIGGLGWIWGSVFGVMLRAAAGWIGELLSRADGVAVISDFFDLLSSDSFTFGVGLIALTFIFPAGLAGISAPQESRTRRFRAWFARHYSTD